MAHDDGMQELKPREIVRELDRFVVGQDDAKRAVAIALRNRWRRRQVPEALRDEIAPKNIIMIGPTGVGKTEIARRLAKLANAPFVKVEASKFTEVGYVGRDVESMIRDLAEIAVGLVRERAQQRVAEEVEQRLEDALVDRLVESGRAGIDPKLSGLPRELLRTALAAGELEERLIEVEVTEPSLGPVQILGAQNVPNLDELLGGLKDLFGTDGAIPGRRTRQRVTVQEGRKAVRQQLQAQLIDRSDVNHQAVELIEQSGIVFIDEIDKIASRETAHGPDVSRGGVQRDLLPVVEGCTVPTKIGPVRTDHILFIAAGAFSLHKPSDLIPELQGRFPIRVQLRALSQADLRRILVEPKGSLITQYRELMRTEGVELEFDDEAIDRIAAMAERVNAESENIGARRLHTIMEKLLEELSFSAPDVAGQSVRITRGYVDQRLDQVVESQDLSRYIL